MFTIEQLQAFVTTSEKGSFSAAARALGKAQSVISQHIMNMELDCGVDLFDRTGRYPVLNSTGLALLPYAKATLEQLERLSNKASSLFEPSASQLILAVDEGVPLLTLPHVFRTLEASFPELQIECLTASSPDIIELVESRRATTGIILSETVLPSTIDFSSLGAVAFDVFVSTEHPLASMSLTHSDQLKLHRQLVIRSKNTQFSSLNQAFGPDVWYADNYFMLLEMAKAGFGWCLLPEHLIGAEQHGLVKIQNPQLQFGWQANIDVIQHQKWHSDPVHLETRRLLRNLFGK
ncbi:LysR family transcriptional regulator [Vibrio vulnificus]|nr:LysR family transcriptional regulator [Vibrio vulnificus]